MLRILKIKIRGLGPKQFRKNNSTRKISKTFLAVLFLGAFIIPLVIFTPGCAGEYPNLETVKNVELTRYSGKWYEIASFPNKFQKGCNCTTAEYTIEEDYVRVINRCRKDSITGEAAEAVGKAFPVEGSGNSKLKVQFFWPFKGDYWIIDLAADYSFAVVGDPARKYLWILYRKPQMDSELFNEITQRASAKGFDISKLKMTEQGCN